VQQNGRVPVKKQKRIIPAFHISTFSPEYTTPFICSGARWYKLPTNCVENRSQPFLKIRACPKSVIFRFP